MNRAACINFLEVNEMETGNFLQCSGLKSLGIKTFNRAVTDLPTVCTYFRNQSSVFCTELHVA